MRPPARRLAACALALLLGGCAPSVRVADPGLPEQHLPSLRELRLEAVAAPPGEADLLAELLRAAVRADGVFAFVDARDPATAPAWTGPGTLGLVLERRFWGIDDERVAAERGVWIDHGGPGQRSVERFQLRRARCLLGLQLRERDGRAVVDLAASGSAHLAPRGQPEHGFRAVADREPLTVVTRADELLTTAADQAIAELLAAITPRPRSVEIALASRGPAADLAAAGDLGAAEERLREHLVASPRDAAAAFDLAAVLEAQARHAEALPWYDRALLLRPDEDWQAIRAACRRRAAAQRALDGGAL